MANNTDPIYLKFFKHSLVEMYQWDREQIFDFLYDACARHPDQKTKEILIPIYKQFLSLCPLDKKVPSGWEIENNFRPLNQKGSLDQAYNPYQHIYRKPTGEPFPIESKFVVNLDANWIHTTPRNPDLNTTRARVSYWNHYDLLGFILSLLEPELEGATKDNFFLPLAAVYGRWCAKIGGDRKAPKPPKPPKPKTVAAMVAEQPGVGAVPAVFQCTWVVGEEGSIYFTLGSSIAGFNWSNENEVGRWRTKLRQARFNLLHGWNDIHTLERDGEEWDFNNSPTLKNNSRGGTHFGNCGETYPFLHIFDSWTRGIRGDVHGLALASKFLANDVLKDKYSPKDMHKEDSQNPGKGLYIIPPCDNCKYLVTVAKGTQENFVYVPIKST